MSQYSHHTGISQNTADVTTESRRQYLAAVQRQRPPPRFRPWMIILMVLAVGCAFIGLTMTIISVWPGYTPMAGNPLKIAGPILLSIGGVLIIFGIVNMCMRSEREKKMALRAYSEMASSRSTMVGVVHPQQQLPPHPATPTPSVDAKPGKSILKNPSTSSHNGTAKSYEIGMDDSGGTGPSLSTNRSYEHESTGSEGSHRLDNIRIETLPDPAMAQRDRKQAMQRERERGSYNAAYSAEKETDIDGDLPPTRKPQPQQANDVHQNRRAMQTYSNEGFDVYDPSGMGQGALTGHGALAGHVTSITGQPPAKRGWGQAKQQGRQAERTAESHVSTVSEQYRDATRSYQSTQQHYAQQSPRAQHYEREPTTPVSPSASTEV